MRGWMAGSLHSCDTIAYEWMDEVNKKRPCFAPKLLHGSSGSRGSLSMDIVSINPYLQSQALLWMTYQLLTAGLRIQKDLESVQRQREGYFSLRAVCVDKWGSGGKQRKSTSTGAGAVPMDLEIHESPSCSPSLFSVSIKKTEAWAGCVYGAYQERSTEETRSTS